MAVCSLGPSQLSPSMKPLTRAQVADGTQCGIHCDRTLGGHFLILPALPSR